MKSTSILPRDHGSSRNSGGNEEKSEEVSKVIGPEPPVGCSSKEYAQWASDAIKDMDVDAKVEFFRSHPRVMKLGAGHTRTAATDRENIRIAKLYDDPKMLEAVSYLV